MTDKYILVGQSVVPCDDLLEWARQLEECDRRVRLTRVGPYHVSTVFIGLDMNIHRQIFKTGEPLLFETMVWIPADYDTEIFGKKYHHDRDFTDIQERCSTWVEALVQHQGIVDKLKKENPNDTVEEVLEDHQKVQIP